MDKYQKESAQNENIGHTKASASSNHLSMPEIQQRLAAISEFSQDAIVTKTLKGIITSWNPGAQRIFGYTAQEVIGKSILILIPQDRAQEEDDILRRISRGETVEHFETVRIKKNGSTIDVSATISPLKDDNGNITGVSKIARDISERKLIENALSESEERFRTLANAMPQIAWITNSEGKLIWCNQRWYEYTGIHKSHFENPILRSNLQDPLMREKVLKCWQDSLNSGEPFEMETPMRGADGNFRVFLTRAQPLKNAMGQITQWFGTNTDIDALYKAEENVRKLNATLEQNVMERTAQLAASNQELKAFSYSVSHDLRSPLRGIDGWSLALLEDYGDKLDAQGREYLGRVRSETQRMGKLIDDLLHLSRLTQAEINKAPVNLSALAETIIADLRESSPERDVLVTIHPDLHTEGDMNLLQAALTNLLENAWKFTGKNPQARIEFGQSQQENTVTYFVRDNGAGFDMQNTANLFAPFQRLHRLSEFPGTGVGLTSVQRIVTRHGGRIWVEAETNKGATFYFTLAPSLSSPLKESL